MKIVTGYTGTAHITSNDDQGRNLGTFGNGNLILEVGERFVGSPADATHFTIEDGEGIMKGVHFRIEPGDTETLTISPAASGKWRVDLIVARYTKNEQTGVEAVTLMALAGAEVSTSVTPSTPAFQTGDIRTGGSPCDMPLYALRVTSEGITGFERAMSGGEGYPQFVDTIRGIQDAVEAHGVSIEELQNGMAMEQYNLTIANGDTMRWNTANCYYFVYGRLAMVAFNIDGRIAVSGSTVLFELPGTKKPTARLFKNCIRRDGKKYVVEVRTNGSIYITNAEDTIPEDMALMRDQIIFPVEETETVSAEISTGL